MQHLGVNFGGIWRFELFSLSGFLFFLLRKSGLIFNSPVITRDNGVNAHRPRAACGRVQCNANAIIYPFKFAIMWRIQTPHLVRLMNIVSNYIFDCNNRNANRAFVTPNVLNVTSKLFFSSSVTAPLSSFYQFLANVNSSSGSLYVVVRPSVVCRL